MTPLKLADIKRGDVVVFIDRRLNLDASHVESGYDAHPIDGREGVVVGFGDSPGRQVCVVLKEPHPTAHVCDGMAPDKRGVYARAENLYTPESWALHRAAYKAARAASAERDAANAKAREIAAAYLGGRDTETITAADVGAVPAELLEKK